MIENLHADLREAVALLAELQRRGLYVEPRGPDVLRIGPPELLDEDILKEARRVKAALLEVLTTPHTWPCTRCGNFVFRLPTLCYWCRKAEERPAHA